MAQDHENSEGKRNRCRVYHVLQRPLEVDGNQVLLSKDQIERLMEKVTIEKLMSKRDCEIAEIGKNFIRWDWLVQLLTH